MQSTYCKIIKKKLRWHNKKFLLNTNEGTNEGIEEHKTHK